MEEPITQTPQPPAVNPTELPDDMSRDAVAPPPKPKSKKKWLWFGLAAILLIAGLVYWFVLKDDSQPAAQITTETQEFEDYMKIPEFGIEVPYLLIGNTDTYELSTSGDAVVFYNSEIFDAPDGWDSLNHDQSLLIERCLYDNPKSQIARAKMGEGFPNEKYTQNSILAEIDGYGYYIAEPGEDCTDGDQEVWRVMEKYVWTFDRSEAGRHFRQGSTQETWIEDNISYTVPEEWNSVLCTDENPPPYNLPRMLFAIEEVSTNNCNTEIDFERTYLRVNTVNSTQETRCTLTKDDIEQLEEIKGTRDYKCNVIQLQNYQAVKSSSIVADGTRNVSYLIFESGDNGRQTDVSYSSQPNKQLESLPTFETFVNSIKFKDD